MPTAPPSTRERQRLATRERVYEAALAVIAERGMAGADVREIVERAGVARGTFYLHFPTKQHVLLELQRREEERIVADLAAHRRPPRNLAATARAVTEAVLASERRLGPSLFADMLSVNVGRATDPEAGLATNPLLGFLTDATTNAAARGELHPDLEPVEAAALVLIALFGILAASATPNPGRDALVGRSIDAVVRGVSAS